MTSRRMQHLSYLVVALAILFAGPSAFAIIWGPVGLPPLGTEREVAFFDCSCDIPMNTGYEEWDCLRHLSQTGSPSNYAWTFDTNCNTSEESPFTYWCKSGSGNWHQITWAEFDSCETCPNP